jgi:hypothetical protein
MKTFLLAGAAALLLSGCVYDDGYYAHDDFGHGYYGPAGYIGIDYDGYYDGYYGPFDSGYWGPSGYFYYRHGGRYYRDGGHHFRHGPGHGYYHMRDGGRTYR